MLGFGGDSKAFALGHSPTPTTAFPVPRFSEPSVLFSSTGVLQWDHALAHRIPKIPATTAIVNRLTAAPQLIPVSTSGDSRLWNEYIERYDYLGHKPLPGAQQRYFAAIDNQVVAAFGFGAAAWKTAPRDEFIGWSRERREANLALIVNNARFLILP